LEAYNYILFDDSVAYEQIACGYGNPFTAVGLLDTINKENHKAAIIDAAGSALGKMVIKLCKQNDIPIIGIVRKQDLVEELVSHGANYVLNSSSPTFDQEIQKLIQELKPTIFLDCIGGDFPPTVINHMPENTQIVAFDQLSGKPLPQSITSSARYSFFNAGVWIKDLSKEDREFYSNLIRYDLTKGGEIFGSKIVKEYPLSEWKKAFDECESVASSGKILLRPQL